MNMDGSRMYLLTFIVSCFLGALPVNGGKILCIAVQYSSHLNEFALVSRALAAQGHEIFVAIDENKKDPKWFRGMKAVTLLYYKSPDKEINDEKVIQKRIVDMHLTFPRASDMARAQKSKEFMSPLVSRDCKLMLDDEEFMNRIRAENFDMAIVDSLYPCGFLIPYKLGIRYMTLSSFPHTWKQRRHPVVSRSPCFLMPNNNNNNFFTRLRLLYAGYMVEKFLPTTFTIESLFTDYFQEKPYRSLSDIMAESELWVVNRNQVLNCAAPTMPNVIHVGGLTTKPAEPLPEEYKVLMNKAKHGVILMSFGSGLADLPEVTVSKFLTAFREIKQQVIWHLENTHKLPLPPNVKLAHWLPQNDILGHPNLKIFINHCGENGMAEAIYHGKPMIGFPIFGDQEENCIRSALKNFSIHMDIEKFTAEELVQNIKEVLENPVYIKTVQKASAIQRDMPNPAETAAFWINHVIKFGSDHLRTPLSDMNVFQFLMLDIFFFILVGAILILLIVKMIINFLFRKLSRNTPAKTYKSD